MLFHIACTMIVCSPPGKDLVTISRALADVEDWECLAALLKINIIEIKTDCAQGLNLAMCYRRELVRRYCDRQQSENPREVAREVAEELEKMGNTLQGAQLREAFSLGVLMVGWVTNTMPLFTGCLFQVLL